ncbi:hypothetical protein HDR62_04885 [bacterium]|nr:hypothetical protein [bacterium]
MQRLAIAFLSLLFFCGTGFAQSAAVASRRVNEDPKADSIALRAAFVADSLAQVQARVSDSLYQATSGILALPDSINQLLELHKTEEAWAAYEAYKESLIAPTPFGLDYLYKEFIGKLAGFGDTTAMSVEYGKLNQKLKKDLRKKYPHKAEVIWYESNKIKAKDSREPMVKLLTKMIQHDPTNLWPYKSRGMYLYMLERYEEALADFERLPDKQTLQEYHNCRMFLGK